MARRLGSSSLFVLRTSKYSLRREKNFHLDLWVATILNWTRAKHRFCRIIAHENNRWVVENCVVCFACAVCLLGRILLLKLNRVPVFLGRRFILSHEFCLFIGVATAIKRFSLFNYFLRGEDVGKESGHNYAPINFCQRWATREFNGSKNRKPTEKTIRSSNLVFNKRYFQKLFNQCFLTYIICPGRSSSPHTCRNMLWFVR